MQSPAKGKCQLVSCIISSGGGGAEIPIGEHDAGESESHAGEGEGYTGGHKEWQYKTEGE